MPYSPAKVKEIQERNQYKYWKLTDLSGKQEYDSILEDCSLDESVETLQASIEDIEDENYCFVKFFELIPEKKTAGQTFGKSSGFKIKLKKKTSDSNQMINTQSFSLLPELFKQHSAQMLDAQSKIFEARMENMKLQFQIENQNSNSLNDTIKMFAPLLMNQNTESKQIEKPEISGTEKNDMKDLILKLDPKEGEETYKKFIEALQNPNNYFLLKAQIK